MKFCYLTNPETQKPIKGELHSFDGFFRNGIRFKQHWILRNLWRPFGTMRSFTFFSIYMSTDRQADFMNLGISFFNFMIEIVQYRDDEWNYEGKRNQEAAQRRD